MANDGQIVFEVTADGKHAIADIKEITRAIQKETKGWDNAAAQATDAITEKFSSLLKKLTGGFSAIKIGKALLNFGQDALQAASDLAEVQNVVDVTFGAGASKIEAWSKSAGTQFGLTETQAKRFASTMGAMLKSSGLAGDKIVDMSTDLAGLAADMASFYNLDFETAFQKIRSGISGETEPLKQLGINMSVANLEAFALQQGLSKTFNEMSQGEQVMLRYQYMMQATADAQGDFSRTSDGYANSLRQLETNFETLKTKLGETLLPVINDVVQAINSLFPTDGEKRKTVLDDFAEIDLKTEEKIAGIQKTAEEARILSETLDEIGGSKAGKAGSQVQQLATDLSNIKLDQGKTGVLKDFLNVLSSNIGIISAIQGTDADGAKAWLEGIAASANSLDADDAAGWSALLESIKTGLPGLENTDFGASFFAALGAGFSDVESKSSVLQWAVDILGNKTDKTAQEQALWLETCQRLVKTIPSLSRIINTETGEIQGGTDAVKEYIQAWEDGQKKLAMYGALQSKESALSSRFSDLPGLELDMALAKRRVRNSYQQLKDLYERYGLELGFDQNGKVYRNFNGYENGIDNEGRALLARETDYYENLVKEADDASAAYKAQVEALEEAKTAIEEYRQTIDEMPGDVEQAADAVDKFWTDNEENITTVVNAAKDALKEMSDYAEETYKNTVKALDGVAKGFERIETPAMKNEKKIKDITDKISALDSKSKTYAKDLAKLNAELAKAGEEKISAQSMGANLAQQAEYMETYLKNLRVAREKGVSDEVLAQLSDGSEESYDYLAELAKAAPGEVEKINTEFERVKKSKEELAKELTGQQLTVDETFKSLSETAKQAVADLDLQKSASDNTGKTVDAVVAVIASKLPSVQSAVDSIVAQVGRLTSLGFDVSSGGVWNWIFKIPGFERGLDYVPVDNMLARLHEGEAVLTAEENRMWQSFRTGQASAMDMETLGGVMRDNVKPGGNVYLDGKEVGKVISDRQGAQYRTLKRSGWQA
jgi:septal ring factor EnvC (AmiA/AmiB activator)